MVAEPLATQTHVAIVLEGGTIIDGTGGPPCSECSILIRGNRIEAIGAAAKIGKPEGAEIVDLRGQFVLPGLIDHHFHIERDSRLALLQLSYGITAFSRSRLKALHDVGARIVAGSRVVQDRRPRLPPSGTNGEDSC